MALAAAAGCLIAVPVTLAAHDAGPLLPGRNGHHHGHHRMSAGHRPASPRAAAARGPATVLLGGPVRPVPGSYLGLSFEYWGMPLFERHLTAFARVLSLLHVPGDGPLMLRVGGDSADRSLWDPGVRQLPQWVFRLAPRWLESTNALLRRAAVRLILDLNLVTASPLRAAAWAQAAETGLRRGSIAAFEIGNEPDIYDRRYWLATITRAGQGPAVLPTAISAQSYVGDFGAYARALGGFAPAVPLMGPAVANPIRSRSWISLLAARARSRLGALTAHRYPYSACYGRASAVFPTIARVLSERASAGTAQVVRPAAQIAHRAGLPFRMTELNSVTCGGRPGVSNSFATALWAPDALFELMRAGVDGVNVHVRADTVNAAMIPAAGGLRERPLLLGLILFDRTLAAGGRLLSTTVQAPGAALKVWGVQTSRSQRRLLLINKGQRALRVRLRIPAAGTAKVERLLAPAVSATTGETLGGRWLGPDGRWRGRPTRERLQPGADGYALAVPAASAALVSIG